MTTSASTSASESSTSSGSAAGTAPAPVSDAPRTDAVLDLQNVDFRRGDRTILSGISFTVRPGEHWALLGANGAGKSTILGFAGARTFPSSGTVDILGERMGRVELAALRKRIGHVNPRLKVLSDPTARNLVLAGLAGSVEVPPRFDPTGAQVARADELLGRVGLGHRLESRWSTMSQGERGRALISRALIVDPELLLLDEPTTGLDIAAREQLLETVDGLRRARPELGSVLVTHHLEELPESTTHALIIKDGVMVARGPVEEAVTSETISEAFSYPIRVTHHEGRWGARAGKR